MKTELCYYVETPRSKSQFWLPYTAMYLAERSRPFYGTADRTPKVSPVKVSPPVEKDTESPVIRKRKIKEDHTLPLNVKISKVIDLNTTYDIRHIPLKQGKHENAFMEFVRRGKEMLFDQYFTYLQADIEKNKESIDYLMNVDASTEDKFELVIKNVVSETEIETYLRQCWRYNYVHKHVAEKNKINEEWSDHSNATSPVKASITVHTPWCLVCARAENLRQCVACPAAFHLACRKEWLVKIIHRKNPPQKPQKPVTLVKKILSSTRTISSIKKEKENVELCPSCMWGPKVGYDDVVWHKLGQCGWWPARVLPPGAAPACLLARTHSPHHWPLRYYGTLNHSWGSSSRMCLLLPSHAAVPAAARDPDLADALLDACDDYISVYLT